MSIIINRYKLKEWWVSMFPTKKEVTPRKWIEDNLYYNNGELKEKNG